MEALAFFGGLALAVGGVLTLALKALSAERRAGDWRAQSVGDAARATSYATQLADTTNRLNEEKARADRIEDAMAAVAAGPVTGAHGRLLAALAAARAKADGGARDVPASEAAAEPRVGDTDLLRPGE